MKEQWGLIGTWNKVHENDVSYLAPDNHTIECYYDAPLEDYVQFNNISEYMNENYGINDENITIYWKGYVSSELRPSNVGTRKTVIGIAYRLENGFFIIMRMSNNKFLYAFYASLELHPDFPTSRYVEVKEKIKNIVTENDLKLNSKTTFFKPEIYSIEEMVDIDVLKRFDGKISEVEKQLDIPFYNPSISLNS